MKKFAAAAAVLAFATPMSAQAVVVFNVNGTLSGGGSSTVTGTFTTNDALNDLTAVNLTSTLGGTHTYNSLSQILVESLPNSLSLQITQAPGQTLSLVFSPALSLSGVSNLVTGSQETSGGNTRTLTGTVSAAAVPAAVPEPATWAMMLVGFGAIGLGMRRKQPHVVNYRFA